MSSPLVCRPSSRAPLGPRRSRPAGFLCPRMPDQGLLMRVGLFIDGFNLYHSLIEAERHHPGPGVKWLDPLKLARNCLPALGPDARLISVDWFSAIPEHLQARDPEKLQRHRLYLRALQSLDSPKIEIHLGRIRRNPMSPSHEPRWSEKGTDVALACRVLELGVRDTFDEALVVSGDTDYLPLPTALERLCPGKRVRFALPFRRSPTALLRASPGSFILSPEIYRASQLENPLRLANGRMLHAPGAWRR